MYKKQVEFPHAVTKSCVWNLLLSTSGNSYTKFSELFSQTLGPADTSRDSANNKEPQPDNSRVMTMESRSMDFEQQMFHDQWNMVIKKEKMEKPEVDGIKRKYPECSCDMTNEVLPRPVRKTMQKVCEVCDEYLKTQSDKDVRQTQKTEWFTIISVIDRLLLICFTTASFLACLIIFLAATL